jgi:hypothetical protein
MTYGKVRPPCVRQVSLIRPRELDCSSSVSSFHRTRQVVKNPGDPLAFSGESLFCLLPTLLRRVIRWFFVKEP